MFLLQQGGIMMWGIVLASFLALAIIIERFFYYRKLKMNAEDFFIKIKETIQSSPTADSIQSAVSLCDELGTPLARIFKVILNNFKSDENELEALVTAEAQKITPKLEERLSSLNTISSVAPLMGLLGTVLGMIKSFAVISKGDIASASVAEGISQALSTTAAGLFVAIPCIVMYNFFARRVDLTINDMESYSADLITYVKKHTF